MSFVIKVSNSELVKLANTGWQSWSYPSKFGSLFKFPLLNYSPQEIVDYTHLSIEYSERIKKPVKGWCSWYAYGKGVSEMKVLKEVVWISNNLNNAIEYILIDDGWCREGDWLKENRRKFPSGMKGIVGEIKALGFKPGLWISPFQASPKSKVVKDNPSWFVKSSGKFLDGLRLTPFDHMMPYTKYLLDIRKLEVQEHLRKVIDTILGDYGYDLIKLDFLYSIYFIPGITYHEADRYLREFLRYIKGKYPKVYTIACGCPLVPAIGLIDSMRVGPDTILSPFFKFSSKVKLLDSFILPRARKAIESRLWTKKYWNLDPDAFVCRRQLGLSQKHIEESLDIIKMSNGNVFLGDDLSRLSKSRIEKYIMPILRN